MRPTTPSQTVGPYYALGLEWPDGGRVLAGDAAGAVTISGVVCDGAGVPVEDALVEAWHADPAGRFADVGGRGVASAREGFRGFARATTDGGRFELVTLKPGPLPADGPGGAQAPHVALSVFARGMLQRVVTRIYFADEPDANRADPVLASVPEARRATLLAEPVAGGYHFDVRLQGEGETVFFDV